MKTNTRSWNKVLALVFSSVALTVAVNAQQIVYDNSSTALGQFYGSTNEFGDQIKLAPTTFSKTITQFKFDYYLSHGVNGDEQVKFNLYDNKGPGGAPLDLLFSSDPISLKSGFNTVVVPMNIVNPPDDLTFTVTFSGIEGNEQGGLLFYNPPTVGSSFDDYWEKVNGTFTLERFSPSGGPIANFGAQVIAVPEPTTIQLALFAGLSWLGMAAYRRRSR